MLPSRLLLAGLAGLALVACAAPQTTSFEVTADAYEAEARKQRELVLTAQQRDSQRLHDVGHPLFVAGTELCGMAVAPAFGMVLKTSQDWSDKWREAAATRFAMAGQPQLWVVARDGPAARAGLAVGDRLRRIDGENVTGGRDGAAAALARLRGLAESGREAIPVTVERAGNELEADLRPQRTCDFGLAYDWDSDSVNAAADGERVIVTRGMLRFADDDELAVVIAHELAHNAMDHLDSKRTNSALGTAGGLILDIALAVVGVNTGGAFTRIGQDAGVLAYSGAFEDEADYVGLYILARAGMPLAAAPDFWRRLAAEYPEGIEQRLSTHPSTPERFLRLTKAIEEIEAKQLAGAPLLPTIAQPAPDSALAGKFDPKDPAPAIGPAALR